MSIIDSDHWYADETITLIAIIKSLKEMTTEAGRKRELDWQEVSNQMAESQGGQNKNRSISELRDRYRKLRNDYFAARYRNRSCQYYNYLNDLFQKDVVIEKQEEASAEDDNQEYDEDTEVEEKYANTLQMELDDDMNHSVCSTSKSIPRSKWVEGEVEAFLNTITRLKLQRPLLRKRNAKVFLLLSREMAKLNFSKRPEQLRMKYNQLRKQYARARKGDGSFEYFEDMHALLNSYVEQPESSDGELDSDSIDSGEEDCDAAPATESDESEDALVASMPKNARVKWADGEVDVFLNMITSLGLQTALLRKRNAKIFRLLSKEMAKRSFNKPPEKLRIKFQQLRRQYNKAKAGGESFEHFDAIHQLLNPTEKRPNVKPELMMSSDSDSDLVYSDDVEADTSKRFRHADSYYWTDQEVDAFLAIIKQHNLFRALDGSKKRNFKTLAYISSLLAKQSYQRTPHQLRNKLRLLLRRYREVKKEGIGNVRILPRHFQMFDDLMKKKRTRKSRDAVDEIDETEDAKSMAKSEDAAGLESECDVSSSSSSCDLLRAAAESDDYENTCDMPADPTPMEVLTSINEGQKELISMFTASQESFLRQQREMQQQFLQEMSTILRQEREATFRLLRDFVQNK